MASITDVVNALSLAISDAVTGATRIDGSVLNVETGIGWPSVANLTKLVVNGKGVAISVYDRKTSTNSSRWLSSTVGTSIVTPLLNSKVTNSSVILTGGIQTGDAVSLVGPEGAYVYTVAATDTLNTIAATLVANYTKPVVYLYDDTGAIVYDATGNPIELTAPEQAYILAEILIAHSAVVPTVKAGSAVTIAAATGSDPTITGTAPTSAFAAANITQTAIGSTVHFTNTAPLTSRVGTVGTRTIEVGRRLRQFQVIVWASSEDDRDIVSDKIEQVLALIENNRSPFEAGLSFPDGTTGRLISGSNFDEADDTVGNVARRDIMLSIDYGVTVTDQVYSALVILPAVS